MGNILVKKFDLTEMYDDNVSISALERLSLDFFLDKLNFRSFKIGLDGKDISIHYCLKHLRFILAEQVHEAIVPLETVFPEVPLLITKLDVKGEGLELELKRYAPYLREFEMWPMQDYSFRTGRDKPEFFEDFRFGMIGTLKLYAPEQEKRERNLQAIADYFSVFYEACTGKNFPCPKNDMPDARKLFLSKPEA